MKGGEGMNKTRSSASRFIFSFVAFFSLSIITITALIPFIMVVVGSFTSNATIIKYGYSVFPREFSTDGYKIIFLFPKEMLQAYSVSIFVTAIGTLLGLVCMAMAGYVLQQRELKYKNVLSFFIYFSTIFNCGLIPWYMVVVGIGLKNTVWSLILPIVLNPFNILLIRNFVRQIPVAVTESARIDGAGYFMTFIRIVAPMSKPALATVGLFTALMFWNDWFQASLFITNVNLYPLQFRLYKVLTAQLAMSSGAINMNAGSLPTESIKLATAVIATGPIIFLYPFLQKYFVQGITIGAVKG
jgi:putative aldouronate transport system permease protein